MAFIPQLEGRSTAELLALLDGTPAESGGVPEDERELWLDEAARLIAEHGGDALDHLLRRAEGDDEDRVAAALLGLSFLPEEALRGRREEVRRLLMKHARGDRPALAARAIDTLRSLGYRDEQPELLPLLKHTSPYVVGSVLRYLSATAPEVARPLLLDALSSPEPIIRSNAIDELDGLECIEALPRLRALVTDPDRWVRQAARTAVDNLESAR